MTPLIHFPESLKTYQGKYYDVPPITEEEFFALKGVSSFSNIYMKEYRGRLIAEIEGITRYNFSITPTRILYGTLPILVRNGEFYTEPSWKNLIKCIRLYEISITNGRKFNVFWGWLYEGKNMASPENLVNESRALDFLEILLGEVITMNRGNLLESIILGQID
jgi:hypothetical protein